MCTHNICFEQKYENSHKNSTEICHFYSREKLQYITWACYRNGLLAEASRNKTKITRTK